MKRNLLFIIFSIIIGVCNGQEKIAGNYYFTKSVIKDFSNQKEYVPDTKSSGDTYEITRNYKIEILRADNEDVYFRYIPFTSNAELKTRLNGTENEKIFLLPRAEFVQYASPLYPNFKGVEVGAYTIPIRLRGHGDTFDFESSLSLSANMIFGWGSQYSDHSIFDASFGIGITKINLTNKNSDVESNRTASAFTFSLGGVFKPKPMINSGLFLGWDFLGANDRDVNWIHNKKMWLGLGINISLNEVKTDKTKVLSSQENDGKR